MWNTKLKAVTLSILNWFWNFWTDRFSREFAIKVIITDPTTTCICCHTTCTVWKYLVPQVVVFTKWVKQSGMKDWNCHVLFNHLKIVVEKLLFEMWAYFHTVRTAQPTERSIIRICVINVKGNRFCSRSSTCNPPSCLPYLPNVHWFKKSFISLADSALNW